MKHFLASLLLCSLILGVPAVVSTGCRGTQSQQVATITSVNQAGISAYDAFLAGVYLKRFPTNGVREVTMEFNSFQAEARRTLRAAQGNSNSVAPLTFIMKQGVLVDKIAKNSKR